MPSKDISMPTVVLTVYEMDIVEFHSRINALWSVQQPIMEGPLDVLFPG